MKRNVRTLIFCALLGYASVSSAQCPIPNRDFSQYWISSILFNMAHMFDPGDWACTWLTGQNAVNYYESGLYPAGSTLGAVEFNLSGLPTETGIRSLEPIVCSDFPTRISGAFRHTGQGSDTLYFSLHFSAIDPISGSTIRETSAAVLISNTDMGSSFQNFDIPIQQPSLNIYTQIDSLKIVYKSVAAAPGIFYLDEVDFGYTSSTHEGRQKTSNIQVLPSITPQFAQIVLPTSSADWQINIVNTTGTTVRSIHNEVSEAVDLDFTGLINGLYYVICKQANGGTVYVGKVVKI